MVVHNDQGPQGKEAQRCIAYITFRMQLSNVGFSAAIAFNSAQLVGAGYEAYHTHALLASDLRDDTLRTAAALEDGSGPGISTCEALPRSGRDRLA